MATELTWHDVLADEKQQPYFINTLHTVAGERQSGITVYPPQKDVFNAFRFTELGDVKVVILGQDPYHGPGQAQALIISLITGGATSTVSARLCWAASPFPGTRVMGAFIRVIITTDIHHFDFAAFVF